MENPRLYRRRIIPEECILLDDLILLCDDERIVTKWDAFRPKKHLHHGYSCYFLKEGYKVSKFYKQDSTLNYWYCDIIEPVYYPDENKYVVTDLLADVIVYPNGFVKVVDLDELAEAFGKGQLTMEQLQKGLRSLDTLLNIIYRGEFHKLQQKIQQFEN